VIKDEDQNAQSRRSFALKDLAMLSLVLSIVYNVAPEIRNAIQTSRSSIVLLKTCIQIPRHEFILSTHKALIKSAGVRGSNPGGGEIFRNRPDRPCGPPSLLYNGYHVSFPEVSGRGLR